MAVPERPRLRPVETILVPDERHGRVLVLRDTQGIADGYAVVPPPLIPIVARMTGRSSTEQIARDASRELGTHVPVRIVDDLVRDLDAAFMLEGASFQQRLASVKRAFAEARVRPASHAGGAYPAPANELAEYIEAKCMPPGAAPHVMEKLSHAKGMGQVPGSVHAGRRRRAGEEILGLVAPHIDPWRGARGYGEAYSALARSLPKRAETFVLLGTSHAPMREPFALTRKAYDTPLGALEVDVGAIARLEKAARFDPYYDELNHKREHSIEFQAVFLKHALGERSARIVPILAGLGNEQASRTNPRHNDDVARFTDALRELCSKDPGKVVVIAGADMAHVGPRFGDPEAHDERQRAELEKVDRASLQHASERQGEAFWDHVAADLESRRVCGLAPIWTLLEVMPSTNRSQVLHYEQTVDADDGSIVSHAAVAFFA